MRVLILGLGLAACGGAAEIDLGDDTTPTTAPATGGSATGGSATGGTATGGTATGGTATGGTATGGTATGGTATGTATGGTATGGTGGTPAMLAVCINEIMPANVASHDVDGAFPDWFELHNPGPADVSLDGWWVSDDPEEPSRHPLPDGLVVPAGGQLVLYASGDDGLGDHHLDFRLSRSGESVVLQDPSGAVNVVNYGNIAHDWAAARTTDCCVGNCWRHLFAGTPGSSNGR